MSKPPLGSLLIVDDEQELMAALCEMLSEQGYETHGFTSPQKALEALEERTFEIVLTDLMMPEMNGIELLRSALALDPHLVGIVMTGQGTIKTAVDAMKMGALDYVLKPFKLPALLTVVARGLEMRRLRMDNLQLHETVAIYELSQAIAHKLELNTIVNKLADSAQQQLQADEVSVMLPTSDAQALYIAAIRGQDRDNLLGQRVPIDRGIAGWVAKHRQACTQQEPAEAQPPEPVEAHQKIQAEAPDSWVVSQPLLIGGKLVGVLTVRAKGRRHRFTLGEVKALGILANTAAVAIDHALMLNELEAAEQKYRSIFENAAEGIFQTTADGRFLTANPALARILGYATPKELIDAVTDIRKQVYVDPQRRSEFVDVLNREGHVRGFESQVHRKDGTVIWIVENARAVRDTGNRLFHYEGEVTDVTERKQAEQLLRDHARRLERSNRELNDFAYVASHDLQEPLRKVQMFGDFLKTECTDQLGESGCDYVDRMRNATGRMQKLINDLLAFSRVTTRAQPFVSVDLREVAHEVISDLEARISETQGHVEVGELPSIEADGTQIRQLLQNLIGNALKFHRPSEPPLVRVWAKLLEGTDGTAAEPSCCQIVVQDNGIGFDQKYAKRIFAPFKRLHGRNEYEGTGIGLTVCRRIVERHGGSIVAQGMPGEGAQFTITLPMRQGKESEECQNEPDRSPSSSLTMMPMIAS